MKLLRVLVICIFICGIANTQIQASNQSIVQGQLISGSNHYPAPGLTVVLVHQNLGRSVPSISDGNGMFVFYNIPLMATPYYLEVYWGSQLIHRSIVLINSNRVVLPLLYI